MSSSMGVWICLVVCSFIGCCCVLEDCSGCSVGIGLV